MTLLLIAIVVFAILVIYVAWRADQPPRCPECGAPGWGTCQKCYRRE